MLWIIEYDVVRGSRMHVFLKNKFGDILQFLELRYRKTELVLPRYCSVYRYIGHILSLIDLRNLNAQV